MRRWVHVLVLVSIILFDVYLYIGNVHPNNPQNHLNITLPEDRQFQDTFFYRFHRTHPYISGYYVCLNLSRDAVKTARQVGLNCSVEVGLNYKHQGHAWVRCADGVEYYGSRKEFPIHYSPASERRYTRID